jgi:hypothetical protein
MRKYALAHLPDDVLLRDLATLVTHDRLMTASLLAHIAEVDTCRLYVPAGYSSMHAYCVEELRLSEDAAAKRIQAARAARRYPSLFSALAEGRLHLAGVCLLAPDLTAENARELIEAATHKRKSAIEEFLGCRFGRLEPPALMQSITPIRSTNRPGILQHAPVNVGVEAAAVAGTFNEHAPRDFEGEAPPSAGRLAAVVTFDEHAPGHVEDSREKPEPALPERFLLKLAISKSTHDKLRYAQALLSHAVPTGELAQVLDRALDALIPQLERRKFGAMTGRPSRRRTVTSIRKRHVPAHVRRAVWERDEGQCTFVSASGTRCKERRFLEFDRVDPVARGGEGDRGPDEAAMPPAQPA